MRIMIRLQVNDGYNCGNNLRNFFDTFLCCTGHSSRRMPRRNSMTVKQKSKLVHCSKNMLISFKSYPVKKGKLKTLSLLGSNIKCLLHLSSCTYPYPESSREYWESRLYLLCTSYFLLDLCLFTNYNTCRNSSPSFILDKHSTMDQSPPDAQCTN